MEKITSQDANKYLENHGTRGVKLLSYLGKNLNFKRAMESPIGKELLAAELTLLEELFDKIYREAATPQEWAEFRVIKRLVRERSEKLASYDKAINEVLSERTEKRA